MARARGAGFALKSLQWFLRAIELCCAALILGVFTYFLVSLHNHNQGINNFNRAIEGISGAAVLYTLCGLLLLCCLAGRMIFSLLAILLDIAFVGAFIFIAYETRSGARKCSGTVDTVFGTGDADGDNTVPSGNGGSTKLPSFKQACQLETACFSVAIVAILFFLLSALVELALMRHHRKEKAFGPSPANNYTAGSTPRRKRFWQGNHKNEAALAAGGLAVHEKHHTPDTLPAHSTPDDVRNSYNTENTAVGTDAPYNKYGSTDGYIAPNAGYREPGYPAATGAIGGRDAAYRESGYTTTTTTTTTAHSGIGNRDTYTGAEPTTATYDNAYPVPAAHETGYRSPTTNAASHPQFAQAGEIPAREYNNNSIHNNY